MPVYEELDDGVVDYYQVQAVNNLPTEVIVPGYVGNIPVKEIYRLTNVDGKWNDFGSTVTTITVQEGVERLEHNSPAWTPELGTVNLPNSLRYIGKNTFSRNTLGDWKSITIVFNGTMAEWKAVEKHDEWDNGLTEDTVVQCTDGYFRLEGWATFVDWKEYPGQTNLDLLPNMVKVAGIELVWDGIDDTNMDDWYPLDEQHPTHGDSYEIAFEPAQGYVMAETISVVIDDTEYAVQTNRHATEGGGVPTYDPDRNVLIIPAALLTTETKTVAIVAYAVPAESAEETDPAEESTEATAPTEVTAIPSATE